MIPYFPKKFASTALALYLAALSIVTVFFMRHAMSLLYVALGIMWVSGFFFLSAYCSKKYQDISRRTFLWTVFGLAFGLRVCWVLFSYWYYISATGIPFEFSAGDSLYYYEEGYASSGATLSQLWKGWIVNVPSVSDSGYILWLALLNKVTGQSVIAVRLVKAAISAATCLLLYRLASRSLCEEVGRMVALFACFMPNLIFYCGLHLKETEMIFLMVAFLERADYMLRSKSFNVGAIALTALLALSLFLFRTVLGAAAVFSVATALVFTSSKVVGKAKRFALIAWGLLAVSTLAGGTIMTEVEGYWEQRDDNQVAKRDYQTKKGNQWAKYATGAVLAPMIFVMPFPTMVDVDEQYTQQMLHGGNYVRNFMGCFVLIALFSAIFIKKNWRDLSLLGSFIIAYLGIISTSGFANSERFLLPGLPVLLIMAAYGVSLLDAKSYKFVKIWYWVVPLMAIAWAYFKIGSRGML